MSDAKTDPIDWQSERDRLTAKLAEDKDAEGWPLSYEAKVNLRHDIAECNRAIRRTHRLSVVTTDKGYQASCACGWQQTFHFLPAARREARAHQRAATVPSGNEGLTCE